MSDVSYSNQELNRFWLNILAADTLLIYNALSPGEVEVAKRAKEYADRLEALAIQAAQDSDIQDTSLNSDAHRAAQDVRKFFIYILDRKTSEDFHLDLKSTAINAFAGETEKYIDALSAFMKNQKPQYDPVEEEVFWLLRFTNHSKYIADNIGNFQRRYREKASELADTLNEFWAFSIELQGIVSRVGQKYSRLADEHHSAVANVLQELYEFTTTIYRLQEDTRIPGTLSLLYLDRIRRMVCFYLIQWARSINATPLDCDFYTQSESRY